jgi:cytochrome c oxidase subunit IV
MSHSREPPVREPPVRIWLRPAAVWTALVLLALATLDAAYRPLDALNTPLNLAIAGIMVILLWLFLMDLIGSATLVRLIAAAGLLWLSFMFALTFSDYLFRACDTSSGGQSTFCVVQNINRRVF